jgi:autotransporter translocation and assembly factor TamB
MAERKVRSRLSRWTRRLSGGLGVFLLLVAGFGAWLVGTTAGGRAALSLAAGFLPDDLEFEVEEFSGRLFNRFELAGLDLRLPTIEFSADRVAIDWRATGMLRKRIHAYGLVVDGLDVRLIEGGADSAAVADTLLPDSTPASPVADFPFDISFDSIVVTRAALEMRDSLWLSGGGGVVRGTIDDYRLDFSGRVQIPDLPPAAVRLSGTGSSTTVHLDSLNARLLGGALAVTGDLSWWPLVSWDLAIRADTLQPAELLPDPGEWPGTASFAGTSTGRILGTGTVEVEAVADTLYGEVRGESLGGRFEARLRDKDLELPAASVAWGPAYVSASGTAGETLALEFEATAPDLGLLLPGSTGRVEARGSATGSREAPRVRASFEAADVATQTVRVATAEGNVDLDLSGPLGATVLARDVSVSGRELDSVTVALTGRRDSHRLEASVHGPAANLDLAARGGLNDANVWSGMFEILQFAADTLGSWTLASPVEVLASADSLRLGEACLESAPARVCVEGEFGRGITRATATVDSFRVERLAPLLPEDLSAETMVTADLAVEMERGGELNGRVEVNTSEGTLVRVVRGENRRLYFEPISVTASSGPDGLGGAIELHLADSSGVRVLDVTGRLDSPAAIRSAGDFASLRGQPVSAHLEVRADDLLLLTDDVLPLWDVTGRFEATADLDLDADGRLTGNLLAATESMVLRNTVRGQGWTLVVDPGRVSAEVGPDGLTGQVDLEVGLAGESDLLSASGQVRLPGLTNLDVDPAQQPVEGSIEFRVGDLGLVEAFLIDIADARGSFLLTTQIGGTLADLTVDGDAQLSDGYALIPTVGLELTDIEFAASGRPEGTIEVSGQVRSGEGLLTLTGRSERYPSAAQPSVFQVRGERFLVLDIPEVNLLANPSLDLAFDGSVLRLTGDVVIPRGRLGFPEIPPSAVTPSEDVRFVGDTAVVREPPVPFGADITVILGDDVFFNGFGFASNLIGSLRIQQEPRREPVGRGEVRFINGTFRSFGQELRIDPGRLLFAGPIDNPSVDARAFVRASDGTEAGFRIGGTVQKLDVSTYSVPPRSDSDVMAYILFGRPMNQTSSAEGSEASNNAAILGANMLGMTLAPSVGLDEARVDAGSSQNKAQFVVGKYLSPRLFVGYGVGIYEPISTLRLRYLLTARWSIEAITGDQQSTDLLWRIETGEAKPVTGAEDDGSPAAESESEVQ